MTADLVTIVQLRHFVLVAERGGFRPAAERAHRSQSALSRSVAQLQRALGERVFEPGSKARLTPFGALALPVAREILALYDRSIASLEQIARTRGGLLRVAAVGAAATNWLPELVRRFRAQHPEVELRLLDDNSRNVQRMVLAGEVDFGIASLVESDARLAFEALVRDDFGLVCRKDHPFASMRSLPWSRLAGLPLIGTVAHAQLSGTAVAEMLRNRPLFVANLMSLVAMLEQGLGVTVLARYGLPPTAKDIVFVPLVRPRIERVLGIVRLREQTLPPPAAAMAALLRDFARAHRLGTNPGRRAADRRRARRDGSPAREARRIA